MASKSSGQLFVCVFLLFPSFQPGSCLHLTGTFDGLDFFKFLSRFGFQQTNMHEVTETQGYIYGNVTSSSETSSRGLYFVVVDSEYFINFFGNRSHAKRGESCALMFNKIDAIAWDEDCHQDGKEDFLRRVPCTIGSVCNEETDTKQVFPGHQFTYFVRDLSQPRYWYVSLVACYRDPKTCTWSYSADLSNITVYYDIWLVNGHPHQRHNNPLEHQFSFELRGIVELFAVFTVAYTFLLPVQLYAVFVQRHVLPFLLVCCIILEYIGVISNVIHFTKFAFDGSGFAMLHVTGNFIDMAAQCLFMLLLLLVVKGWMITHKRLSCEAKLVLFPVWIAYSTANVALFAWNQIEVDLISDIDEWQTWPGWLILTFRLLIMLWFLWELRNTFVQERDARKTSFYLHYGAGFLVWFVYLPLTSLVCAYVSSLWRYKTILSVSYSADLLSLCVMVHLLWPSRTYLYFNIDRLKTNVNLDAVDFPAMSLLRVVVSSSDDSDDVYSGAVSPVHQTIIPRPSIRHESSQPSRFASLDGDKRKAVR